MKREEGTRKKEERRRVKERGRGSGNEPRGPSTQVHRHKKKPLMITT